MSIALSGLTCVDFYAAPGAAADFRSGVASTIFEGGADEGADRGEHAHEGSASSAIDPANLERAELHLYALVEEVFQIRSMGLLRRNLLAVTRSVVRFSFQGRLYGWIMEDAWFARLPSD